MKMKKYNALFYRGNHQLKNGGYKTTKIIEAASIEAAEKKAHKIEKNVGYGWMELISISPIE